jgi:hypothetical protein
MRLALIIALIGCCYQAQAQDYPMPDFPSNMQLYNTEVAVSFEAQQMMRQANERANRNFRVGSNRLIARRDKPSVAQVNFTSSLIRRQANLANFVSKSRAVDPAGADKMQALFAQTDVIGIIDQKMQESYGMHANNVADAYAVWWVSAWMGAKGRSDDATPVQMAMVKRQATDALASTPEFASATDAGKQELAESLLVHAALIGATVETYASDPAMLGKARTAIAKGASGMGLDLSKMTLTDQGFVPSGKSGRLR